MNEGDQTTVVFWPTHRTVDGGISFDNAPDETFVLELLPFHRGPAGNDAETIFSGIDLLAHYKLRRGY